MRIALAQMRVLPGRPEHNVETMERFISQARHQACDMVAFPEMCVGGYLLGDRWTEEAWCEHLMTFNERLRLLSKDMVIVYGNVYVDKASRNKDGRSRKFNAAYAYSDGEPLKSRGIVPDGIVVKTLLPNYRIFDDERYFFSSQELAADRGCSLQDVVKPFEVTIGGQSIRVGIEICEDLWFGDYRYGGAPLNVTRFLVDGGAQHIINISASPWTYGKDRARNNRIKESHAEMGRFVPFYYVNCVGVQNNGKNIVTFDGDSTVYNDQAQVVATASEPFEEELLVYDTEKNSSCIEKALPDPISSKFKAIVQGLRGMDELSGREGFPYVIGLSGGVDSALVTALVHHAVGGKRIIACNLPSRFNTEVTKGIAKWITEKLGIPLSTIPIEEIAQRNRAALDGFSPTEFNYENIQAKVRGTSILSNIAGIANGLMTCNGNKIEIALGYATLYGDVNGAIAPIGDLLKTEVFAMASYMNREIFGEEVIPSSLIPDQNFEFSVPPSAELREAQVDPMKWGYHDALVQLFTDYKKITSQTILEWYEEDTICDRLGISEGLFRKYHLNDPRVFVEDLEWVVRSIQSAVYKRIQSPPIIILSKGSYGFDIRESQLPVYQTDRYRALRRRILAKGGQG